MASGASPSTSRSSREAFVHTTAELLRRQGYAATGLNEIVARSGAPKGSLYFHFPGGKEELAESAIASAGEQLAAAIEAILCSCADVEEAVARLIDALAAGLKASDYRDGCPVATVALETSFDSERLRAASARALDSWEAALRERLLAAGLAAETASRRATLALASIEGALMLARVRRSTAPLLAVREELLASGCLRARPEAAAG